MSQLETRERAIECLALRGASQVAHPGGTLLDHLRRTAARLQGWGAAPELVAAGACHAAYGTVGFPTALVELSERGWLRECIGERAESIVYAYCANDRASPPPQAQRDRFTGDWQQHPGWLQRALAELTAANELDVAEHIDARTAQLTIGPWLASLAPWLTQLARAAVARAACCQGLGLGPCS